MTLLRFLLKRIVIAILTVYALTTFLFFAMRLIPGDPVTLFLGPNFVNPVERQYLIHLFGFDQPVYVQYLRWLSQLLQGNLGVSFEGHQSVAAQVANRIPISLELTGLALVIAIVTAL